MGELEQTKQDLAYTQEQLAFAMDKLNEAGEEIARLNAEINEARAELIRMSEANDVTIMAKRPIRDIEIHFREEGKK